ncbi:TonB-dependent receptor [Hephaestia sp. GCM10023244]|uniref:TonB-dependent receptor n=1 Tax=unclassified Hephaestia TaxID=2631281 RepID=UPI002076F787|nr:TonB-dependent receptor [Hephaestia sp. MAHUQ-44]MCM8729979.1 TonB-dependent receptor [Hephaestia sp. MAHUQ-44]
MIDTRMDKAISARRASWLIGASALAFGLAAPALAQTTAPTDQQAPPPQDTTVAQDDADDAIVVTGLRASLASAQAIKQNSGQFVDSITAIDIGKLPDKNVAEALQRISGIQITRNRGEGSSIAIRGLTQVRTEVNGRDSFGASGGRSLSFEDVPSELLAGIDVYKNPSAIMIEGGVGGLVNLRTRMPFDQADDRLLVSGTVGLNYYDLIDDSRFNASLLASKRWKTGIGDIGILVDVSTFEGAFRSDDITIEPYFDRSDIPGSVGTVRSVPDGAGIGITFGERKRRGFYGAVQWAPADDLEIYGQVFRSDYRIETPNYTSFVTCGTDVNCATNQMQPAGPFKFDADGKFISGSFTGFGATANNAQFTSNRSITTDYSAGFKWRATDRLKINGDFQYIDATAENRSFTAFPQRDGGALSIDLSGKLPQIQFGPAGVDDPANYYIIALMDHLEDSNAHEYAGRLDLEWDFDESSVLQDFTAGVRYTDRSAINRSTPYNWQFLSAPWGGSPIAPDGLRLTKYAISNPFDSSFFYGDGTGIVGAVPFFNWPTLRNGGETFLNLSKAAGPSCCGPYPRTLIDYTGNDINTQHEKTYAAYAMMRFDFARSGGLPLDGNIGVRVVKTSNDAIGQYVLTYRTPAAPTTDINVTSPFSGSQDYTEVLPSLNLRYHLTDRLQARFAASRGLSRPPFYDMRAIFNLTENYRTPTACPPGGDPADPGCAPEFVNNTGDGGNPSLKPLTVSQADIALEWYPNSTTMLYGTLFYKRVKNFQGTAVYDQSFEVPGKGEQTFQVTAQVNGDAGTIKGFELGGNTFFGFLPEPFDGFGVQANLTYVDSKAPSLVSFDANGRPLQTPLQGLSRWSYNVVGFYEKYGFTARAAWNWRNDYLDTVNGNGTGAVPIFRRPYGQLDASISYDFTPFFSVSLDGVNLTREMKQSYQAIPSHPRDYLQEDRRIGISLRLRTP